jgi:hypothetical protein
VGAVHAGDYEKITGARSLESESRRKQIVTKVTKVSSEVKMKIRNKRKIDFLMQGFDKDNVYV